MRCKALAGWELRRIHAGGKKVGANMQGVGGRGAEGEQGSGVRHRWPCAGGAMTGELQGGRTKCVAFVFVLPRLPATVEAGQNERVLRASSGSCQSGLRRGKPGGGHGERIGETKSAQLR